MLYLNHSCDPNCAIAGQIVFVAMRDIAAGEELTHDWATTDDLDYELDCRCGSAACRRARCAMARCRSSATRRCS